jgi:pimeloyl-ACP methyl ester carboxylesterase
MLMKNRILMMLESLWFVAPLILAMSLIFLTAQTARGAGGPRQVALVSTTASCVDVSAGAPAGVSTTVRLEWDGQIDEAFLMLAVAGSEGGHSLYINGQRVGSAPINPTEQACQPDSPATLLAPVDEIPIPVDLLKQGENVITLTHDANSSDDWSVIRMYLEIRGVLTGPPVAVLEGRVSGTSDLGIAATTQSTTLESSYDPGYDQVVWYQVPDNYTGTPGNPSSGTPTPLLVAIHGMGGYGEGVFTKFGPLANSHDWLLVAPDMHNFYKVNDDGTHAIAWVGAQHDVIDAIEYMMDNYNVRKDQIYIVGQSMGGQTTLVMMAKYPDIFAAAAEWMGYTDLAIWYNELSTFVSGWPSTKPERIRQEITGTNGANTFIGSPADPTPAYQFEYQRRSPISMPGNGQYVPLLMWHGIQDTAVISTSHPIPMLAAINYYNPTPLAVLNLVDKCLNGVTDNFGHCFSPADYPSLEGTDMFNFLAGHMLSSQPPFSLTIRTDESKPYYWLNFDQPADHWTEAAVNYNPATKTISAVISDTQPLQLGFNLGTLPIDGSAGLPQAGLGLSYTSYRVQGGGHDYIHQGYTAGNYLTVTLTVTGQYTLTISPYTGASPYTGTIYLPIVLK